MSTTSVSLFANISGSFGQLSIYRIPSGEFVVRVNELEPILRKFTFLSEEDREEGLESIVLDSLSVVSKNVMLANSNKRWASLEAQGLEPVNSGMFYWLKYWSDNDSELMDLLKLLRETIQDYRDVEESF